MRWQGMTIGIDGPGGSGKSTLAVELASKGPGAVVVHVDDFYLPANQREPGPHAFDDFDWERLARDVLVPVRLGERAVYQRYDWVADQLAESHSIPQRGTCIVEGVYSTQRRLRLTTM